jgi:hypothetical protein
MEYLRCKCTQALKGFIPGKKRTHGTPSKATITNKTRKAGSFSSQAGRLAGSEFYVYVFSLGYPVHGQQQFTLVMTPICLTNYFQIETLYLHPLPDTATFSKKTRHIYSAF